MFISMHNWMRSEDFEKTLQRLKKYGINHIEIAGDPQKYHNNEIKSLLEKYEIQCLGSVTLMLGERNLLAKDEKARRNSVQYVKDCVSMVSDFGGSLISLVPGTVGKIVSDSTPEKEWRWAVESVKEIYDFAEEKSIRIGIEPINRFETYFINRGAQAYALAKEVGDNCGVCLDIFHMAMEESHSLKAIRSVADRLINVHVSDNNRFGCGMGDIDWSLIVQRLKEVSYDGPLGIEFCPNVDRTPANPFPNSIDHNPEGFTKEESDFIKDHGSAILTEEFYSHLVEVSVKTLKPLL